MGKVVQVYHGTPNKFDEFSLDFIGSESGTTGAGVGLYFTESEAEALTYGENIFKCLLKLKNNISNDEVTLTFDMIYMLIEKLYKDKNENWFENWLLQYFPQKSDKKTIKIIDDVIKHCSSDTEIISGFVNSGIRVTDIFDVLLTLGYDHTIDNEEPIDGISKHYIVYDLNCIQILDKYTLETRK